MRFLKVCSGPASSYYGYGYGYPAYGYGYSYPAYGYGTGYSGMAPVTATQVMAMALPATASRLTAMAPVTTTQVMVMAPALSAAVSMPPLGVVGPKTPD